MKIAFPTETDKGLDSIVYHHFGSAQWFVIVDLDTGNFQAALNRDKDHIHGMCNPVAALGENKVDAVVVGGIGAGALMKLKNSGIKVYRGIEGAVSDHLPLIKSGKLPEFQMNHTCQGHHGHGGCAH